LGKILGIFIGLEKEAGYSQPEIPSAIAPNAQFRASMRLSQHNLADQ
jgi:hypothetical protein